MEDKMDFKGLLLKHYNLYPLMQIEDMVKLIYQSEFAGGHLIKSFDDSLKRLREEFETLDGDTSCYLSEEIGSGLCRLHLSGLKGFDVSLETVNRFFVNTANSVHGSVESFEQKLDVLRECCSEGVLPYSLKALDDYLISYKDREYPPVSHSEIYRKFYSPAYRIVKLEYMKFFEAFSRIDSLLKEKDTVNVAIDGMCGAGKSTLASLMEGIYDCNVFHMDDYFLPPKLRTEERLKEAGGNVDYVRFKEEIIEGIKSRQNFEYQVYDCSKGALGRKVSVKPKRLNIIEGSYSMHPTLIDNYDLKIFLYIDEQEQSQRILKRNGPVLHERFISLWIPLENRYFKEMKIKDKCDIVFRM